MNNASPFQNVLSNRPSVGCERWVIDSYVAALKGCFIIKCYFYAKIENRDWFWPSITIGTIEICWSERCKHPLIIPTIWPSPSWLKDISNNIIKKPLTAAVVEGAVEESGKESVEEAVERANQSRRPLSCLKHLKQMPT